MRDDTDLDHEGDQDVDLPLAVQQNSTPRPVAVQETHAITPAQAKIEAVAQLTAKVYERASMLEMTPEEMEKLQADFPDEAFRPGAAGKKDLIYIEHAELRERLNEVFGPGKWALIPRTRWAEPFKTYKDNGEVVEGVRVYVEAMLCVRGCFVDEAIGDMAHYPGNQATNYGDAVEGAKTQALRRCAKTLGIGLQAWKKSWCEGWWKRRNDSLRPKPSQPAQPATQTTQPAPKQEPPPLACADHEQCRKIRALLADLGRPEAKAVAWVTASGSKKLCEELTPAQADKLITQLEYSKTKAAPKAAETPKPTQHQMDEIGELCRQLNWDTPDLESNVRLHLAIESGDIRAASPEKATSFIAVLKGLVQGQALDTGGEIPW